MKRLFLLLLPGLLAASLAVAQDMPSSTAAGSAETQNPQMSTQQSSTRSSVIRGCLSGSSGNYTLTDQNGVQYQVTGDDAVLSSMVGREVEISGLENQSSEASAESGETMSHTSNGIQASQVRAVSSNCNKGSSAGTPPPPMSEPAESPKGTPDTASPPKPQLMALLQQQSTPDAGVQPQNGSKNQQPTTPPVTSQTPASPKTPANSNSPESTSPANSTGMTPDEADRDAQAARQGELNTDPRTGKTTGRGVNGQGENNPSQTNPNAVPRSRNSATPQSSNSNDSGGTATSPPK